MCSLLWQPLFHQVEWLKNCGLSPGRGKRFFSFSEYSGWLPPIQWVMRALSPGVNQLEWKSNHWPPPYGELRMHRAILPLPLMPSVVAHKTPGQLYLLRLFCFSHLFCRSVLVIFYVTAACMWHLNDVANLVFQIQAHVIWQPAAQSLRLFHMTAGSAALATISVRGVYVNIRFFLDQTSFLWLMAHVTCKNTFTAHWSYVLN